MEMNISFFKRFNIFIKKIFLWVKLNWNLFLYSILEEIPYLLIPSLFFILFYAIFGIK